jgi:hypothetical protein
MRSNAKSAATATSARLDDALAVEVRRLLLDAITCIDAADSAALTIERAPAPIAPARLAAAHPGDEQARAQVRQLYERCLAHYRAVVRPQDEARGVDNVGAAVAAFVAANFGALQGIAVTPDMLLHLERQLGGMSRLGIDWSSAPMGERQAYFEQMAVLAVLVTETSAQAGLQGAAAVGNVQRAARGYLQQLLGLNPDHLTLGPKGLAARKVSAQAG